MDQRKFRIKILLSMYYSVTISDYEGGSLLEIIIYTEIELKVDE